MRALRTLLFCGMCCLYAQAGNFTYITPPGSSFFGLPVDTKAVFSISNGMLDVTLENLQANPKHETQLLLSVTFDLRDGNLNHASLISSSGQETTVHSNGTFTLGSTGPTGWRLQTFVIAGHLYPTLHHRIIGPPGSGNTYSNADSSIAGNSHNNPFLNRSASFVITGPDITSNTQISTVYFYFMAGPFGEPIKGVRTFSTVPEPSAELLLGLGTLGLMGLATVSRKLIST